MGNYMSDAEERLEETINHYDENVKDDDEKNE
jgi:hypothetical protein